MINKQYRVMEVVFGDGTCRYQLEKLVQNQREDYYGLVKTGFNTLDEALEHLKSLRATEVISREPVWSSQD